MVPQGSIDLLLTRRIIPDEWISLVESGQHLQGHQRESNAVEKFAHVTAPFIGVVSHPAVQCVEDGLLRGDDEIIPTQDAGKIGVLQLQELFADAELLKVLCNKALRCAVQLRAGMSVRKT